MFSVLRWKISYFLYCWPSTTPSTVQWTPLKNHNRHGIPQKKKKRTERERKGTNRCSTQAHSNSSLKTPPTGSTCAAFNYFTREKDVCCSVSGGGQEISVQNGHPTVRAASWCATLFTQNLPTFRGFVAWCSFLLAIALPSRSSRAGTGGILGVEMKFWWDHQNNMSRIYRRVDGRGCGQWMEGRIDKIDCCFKWPHGWSSGTQNDGKHRSITQISLQH